MKILLRRLTLAVPRLSVFYAAFLLLIGVTSHAGLAATGNTYTVSTTADNTNSVPLSGAGTAGNPYVMSSLRGAVLHANAGGVGPHVINVPAGTYNLSVNNPGSAVTVVSATVNNPAAASGV